MISYKQVLLLAMMMLSSAFDNYTVGEEEYDDPPSVRLCIAVTVLCTTELCLQSYFKHQENRLEHLRGDLVSNIGSGIVFGLVFGILPRLFPVHED
jgi:hypothetical protein